MTTAVATEPLDPGRHFMTDVGPSTLLVTAERCVATVPLTPPVASPTRRAPLGVLLALCDIAASHPALVAGAPDWTATQEFSVHSAAAVTEGPVVVDCRLIRVGKKAVTLGLELFDGRGVEDLVRLASLLDSDPADADGPVLAGAGTVTFARLPRAAASNVDGYDPAQWIGEVRGRTIEGDDDPRSLRDRMGLELLDPEAGAVLLSSSPYVANSIGTINGGSQSVLIEVAAEAACPGFTATDAQLRFLSQLRAGPARTSVTPIRDAADHRVVAVEVVDAGNDDAVLTLATVTLLRD